MKYAIFIPADQTIVYLTGNNLHDTTNHKEAKLWNNLTEIDKFITAQELLGNGFYNDYMIESVKDEEEFRNRKDTW